LCDNGQGFAVEESEGGPTLGLAGMRERVFSIAGDLAISSTPGQGTTVEVTVPLEAPARVTVP
jgi:signal transduction histidine kinase